jgi:peptide/nickel transport system permease protein
MSIAPREQFAAVEEIETERQQKPEASRGYWAETWRHFKRRPVSVVALWAVVFLTLVAIFSPAIVGTKPIIVSYKGSIYFPALGYFHDSLEPSIFRTRDFRINYPHGLAKNDPDGWAIWPLVYQNPYDRVRENEWPDHPGNPSGARGVPSRWSPFGTTQYGIDAFAQVVHGTRTAITIGFVSMSIAATIGIIIGAISGYFGGWVDMALSRFTEVVMCVPTLVLILALVALVEQPTIYHIMGIIGLTGWTGISRLTRAEFLRLRESDFITAARAVGVGRPRIIFRHILPNAFAPILVPIIFGIAAAVLLESALSFLGFGPSPPTASWGRMLNEGRSNYEMWWLWTFPGLAIFITVLAYNLIGEGFQEATDPRTRDSGR